MDNKDIQSQAKKLFEDNCPPNTVLSCLSGSHAHGMAHENSDIDVKGIFIAPTHEILSIDNWSMHNETIDHADPDYTYHELGKILKLSIAANPTILELIFIKDHLYLNEIGEELISMRYMFITDKVYDTYFGYATAQMRRLESTTKFVSKYDKRRAKHVRHMFRLLYQLRDMIVHHDLIVKLDSNTACLINEYGNNIYEKPEWVIAQFNDFKDSIKSMPKTLPTHNSIDINKLNDFLMRVRQSNW